MVRARRPRSIYELAKLRTLKDTVHTYTVPFEPAAEGGYTVTVPAVPGAITEGDTLEEARQRAREVIRGHLKVLKKYRRPIPVERRQFVRPLVERVSVSV